jgi:hypothetical protein
MVSVGSAPYIFFSAGCEIEQWQHVATELRGKTKTFTPLNASEKINFGSRQDLQGSTIGIGARNTGFMEHRVGAR